MIDETAKIYIWGTGFAARELLEDELKELNIAGFIDSDPTKESPNGSVTYTPDALGDLEYDLVIVATGYAKEIYLKANELGLDMSKFLFVYNNYDYRDLNNSYAAASKMLSAEMIDSIKGRCRVIRSMDIDGVNNGIMPDDPLRQNDMYKDDYVRIRTFELCANEIKGKKINGAVAELGVYRGEFARYINMIFSDRNCYLFDTFEGFRESEAQNEKSDGNCGDAFIERFQNTSLEIVLNCMPCPDKIILKQGFFPESLNGLEEKFAFVSIDVDFEQSIFDGLTYFYPRLNAGGYIFVHDYNSVKLKGVKRAVERFEEINGAMNRFPLSDVNGTLVITK